MQDSARAKTAARIIRSIRGLQPDRLVTESERLFFVSIIGASRAEVSLVRERLMGEEPTERELRLATGMIRAYVTPLDEIQMEVIRKADIIIVTPSAQSALEGRPLKAFVFDPLHPAEALKSLAAALWSYDYRLSIARRFPALRRDFGGRIVQQVTLENTFFVVTTGLRNVVPNILEPILGPIEAVSDTLFLTANQIRMLFMLGAAYGRDIGYGAQFKEILSIVGAALGWRSLARSLVSIVPFGGGLVLKGNIAYAGTIAVGHGIIFLYTTGRRMTRQEVKQEFKKSYSEAMEFVRSLVGRVRGAGCAGSGPGSAG